MFRLAELMEGEGMEVQPCYNNEWADGTWTTLEFQGDDSAGNKAVELATDNDFRPKVLQGHWTLDDEESCGTEWTFLFHSEEGGGRVMATDVEQDRSIQVVFR